LYSSFSLCGFVVIVSTIVLVILETDVVLPRYIDYFTIFMICWGK